MRIEPGRLAVGLTGRRLAALMGMVFLAAVTGFVAMLPWGGAPVLAQEAISQEEPTPSSVDEVVTSIQRSFQEKPSRPEFFPRLKEQLKDTPPFLRDTKLELNLRTYYFYRDNLNNSKNEAWAIGGSLSYRSGWFLDHFGGGAVLYTSQPLYAPDNRDGTQLLKPGQEGYTVLGQIYGRVKLFEENFINIYRYTYNTPYINMNDSRMTPNTFEGYTFQGAYGGKDGSPKFTYGGGYIDKIKSRDSTDFISMSRAAGADVKRGVFTGGGNVSIGGFQFGGINYYSQDVINIGYGETKYVLPVTERLGLLFAGQYSDQRSTGKHLLTGASFMTNQVGVKTDMSYGGAILTIAYTNMAKGANMQKPWSSYPGYTSVQVKDFNRAGEEAVMVKGSYDFSRLGLEGVTAYALLVHGWGAVNPATTSAVINQNEYDFDAQWRPKIDFLKGVWFRGRYARVEQQGSNGSSINEFRVMVNYDFPLF